MLLEDILQGESQNVEFKETLPAKSAHYMKTVVAFANGSGGTLLFGIQDRTCKVVGIENDAVFQTMDAITNAISDSCEPVIVPDVTLQTVDDKTIIVVEISAGKQKPYYIKSMGITQGTYVRVAGTTRPADGFRLKELLFEGSNRGYDQSPCIGYAVQAQEIAQLCRSLKETAVKNCKTETAKAAVKDVTPNTLLSWGVLVEENGTLAPANAFALLSGNPILPTKIQCGIFKGTTRSVFVDRREFTGSIQDQIEAAYQYVLANIHLGAKIEGLYRQDEYELPPASIREIIANAVTHRSYLDPGNVQVALYDNRLEVTSPGMLLNGVSIQKIKEGYSKIRNRAIASAFSYMKIIEQWGSGIPRMMQELEEYSLPEPELIDLDGDFRVNFYRKKLETTQTIQKTIQTTQPKQTPIQLTTLDKTILDIIAENPSITQQKIAVEIGWPLARVKYYTKKLRDKNLLSREGSGRKGIWKVLLNEK